MDQASCISAIATILILLAVQGHRSASLPVTSRGRSNDSDLHQTDNGTLPLRLSNETLQLLQTLTRDPRIGDRLLTYIQDRRNKMLERWKIRRERRRNKTAAANNKAGNKTDRLQALMGEEDEDYDYDEDYPDYDFSPTSIFIFVLELFGSIIGLTWGTIATIWNAG